jgi:aminoglycoside phosphotransferase (APT) family kinase protein
MGTPAAEVEIDERQVRELLAAQHPDLADLSIVPIASGWDNHLLRLGDSWPCAFPAARSRPN